MMRIPARLPPDGAHAWAKIPCSRPTRFRWRCELTRASKLPFIVRQDRYRCDSFRFPRKRNRIPMTVQRFPSSLLSVAYPLTRNCYLWPSLQSAFYLKQIACTFCCGTPFQARFTQLHACSPADRCDISVHYRPSTRCNAPMRRCRNATCTINDLNKTHSSCASRLRWRRPFFSFLRLLGPLGLLGRRLRRAHCTCGGGRGRSRLDRALTDARHGSSLCGSFGCARRGTNGTSASQSTYT